MTTRKIILKSPTKAVIKEIELTETEALVSIWHCLGEADLLARSRLVFKGRVLQEEWLTLAEVFGECTNPIVYVVRNRANAAGGSPNAVTSSRSNEESGLRSPALQAVTGSQPVRIPRAQHPVRVDAHEEEDPRCRICYSSENVPHDRLFRPCLCRGSMALVHISCLNLWRERPDNPDAHVRCVNCGYNYRIARANFATLLSSDEYVQIGALVFTLILIGLVAFVSWLTFPDVVLDRFFEFIEWYPPDHKYPFVRYLVFGAATLGLIGFLSELRDNVDYVWHHGSVQALFGIIISITAHGARGLRLFSACGLAVAYKFIFNHSQVIATRILTRFGERVLEVTE